jgi:hypothetical protein
MKKFNTFFFTLLLSIMTLGLSAQSTDINQSSPVCQGDFIVGTNVANVALSDLQLSASVGYALTDQIVVGLSELSGNDDSWSGALFGRYYLNSPFYAQGNVGYDSLEDDANFGASIGVTGFLANWVFVEPNVGVNFGDNTEFNLGLSFGLRF